MGAFFTNLQVRGGALAAVEEAIREIVGDAGYVGASDGETADRSVILVQGEGWVSVYDSDTEDQDAEKLAAMGARLAVAVSAPVLSVLVHDSDMVLLQLHREGSDVERELASRASDGADLAPVADAFGIDRSLLSTGYRYLSEEGAPEGAVLLAFRFAERPSWERRVTGPPRLLSQQDETRALYEAQGWARRPGERAVEVAVSGELRVPITTRSVGGAFAGVRVEVRGGELLDLAAVELIVGDPRDPASRRAVDLVREGQAAVARFPDAKIEAGLAADARELSSASPSRAMELRFGAQVHVNLTGTARRTGEERLEVRVIPEGTPAGAACVTVPVRVRSTEGRPLRAPVAAHPSQLDVLAQRDWLVALVLFEGSRTDGAKAADRILKAVAPSLPADGTLRTAAMCSSGTPRIGAGPASGFLTGEDWRTLVQDYVEGADLVQVSWPRGERDVGASLYLGPGMLAGPSAVPALAINLYRGGPDAEVSLRDAIDGCAREGGVVQGLLTRWGQPSATDLTPYETAVGVHGQCTLERWWVGRWLRAVGLGHLWLGAELLERVALGALEPRSTQLGDTVRIDIDDVPTAESTLADLLPGEPEWQEGMRRRYEG